MSRDIGTVGQFIVRRAEKETVVSFNLNQIIPTQFTAPPGNVSLLNTGNNPQFGIHTGDIMNPQYNVAMPPGQGDINGWLMNMLTTMFGSLFAGGGLGMLPEHGNTGNAHGTGATIAHPPGSGGGSGGSGGSGKPLGGNFTFQAGSGDRVANVKDPSGNRSNVIRLDFNTGTFTTNSTSPRAELKINQNLREGGNYGFQFGVMRNTNYDSTIFQVLDHNGAKPAPRMWIAVEDGKYILHLREEAGANSKVIKHDLGKASVGKWDDIKVDFKRGVGNGSVSININGKEVFSKDGISTMYNTHSGNAYPKIGQYRNQGDKSPGSLYISDFTISGG